ncbi:MAG: potassium-transporting ATPase subunit C [Candidatus Hydrogenedentes bacterium]|nr:potassium-transporting ATPase subunit C [Candidatus Hydrogenedentota bacterium]
MKNLFEQCLASLRVVAATLAVCSGLYVLVILGAAQLFTPHTANGSLIEDGKGGYVGSELLATGFTRPEYLWPRPSACNYDASATGGSNLSPTSDALRERVQGSIAQYGVEAGTLLPTDLVTASGGGLDPHITLQGALVQTARIAGARGVDAAKVEGIVRAHGSRPGWILGGDPIVNVLLVNLDLDKRLR